MDEKENINNDNILSTQTSEEKPGGYITNIKFNNGEDVNLNKNDIIVFVGPNNAGKSQSLKDIFSLAEKKNSGIVISDIDIFKNSSSVLKLLNKISVGRYQGHNFGFDVLNNTFWQINAENFYRDNIFGALSKLFIANLDTAARLSICNPPNNIKRTDAKQYPIHYAAFDSKYRKWLSNNFKKAFGIDIIPNTQFGSIIPLCIGTPVNLNEEYEDEQTRQEEYANILEKYDQVQNQGDGIKSFVGILLYLMLDYFCIYLIDEPESFLHPPQARIMGQIIGETLSNQQQAFISTHSEEIIKGLMDVCPERVKIVRITRQDTVNHFSVLDNKKFNEVWDDPLLKYSNIMSSLFHKSVVLCESDSDCKIYSIIDNHLKQKAGRYSEALFIHCGGKHRMARIVRALRSLGIDVKLIPDIDVLNDENVFRGIVEAFDIEWSAVQRDYNVLANNLHSSKENINREEAKRHINDILDKSNENNLSKKEVEEIRKSISISSKWKTIKDVGFNGVPAGEASSAIKKMNNTLKEKGIYLVPVGELECFIKDVGGHASDWVNKVLEKYPDLDDEAYSEIKKFIAELNL